jgi:hypothetical protein
VTTRILSEDFVYLLRRARETKTLRCDCSHRFSGRRCARSDEILRADNTASKKKPVVISIVGCGGFWRLLLAGQGVPIVALFQPDSGSSE